MKLLRGALLRLAALAIFARLFLIWNIDRSGGVTCIWLRLRPALEWQGSSTGDPAGSHAVGLICGDENGVLGEDLLRWNAHVGWWLFPTAALTVALVDARMKKRAYRGHGAGS